MDPRGQSREEEAEANRAAVYGLLALLLLHPDEETFNWLTAQPAVAGDDTLAGTWLAMISASRRCGPRQAMAAHAALFVARDTTAIAPYGWAYVGRPMMSSSLRQDMHQLGVGRAGGVMEAEDHIGVLLYTMRQLILQGTDAGRQAVFFLKHIAPWVQRCLTDIAAHPRAGVYASIARFAGAYLACEQLEHEARCKAEMSS